MKPQKDRNIRLLGVFFFGPKVRNSNSKSTPMEIEYNRERSDGKRPSR